MDVVSSTISTIISTVTDLTLSDFRSQVLWALIVGIILAFLLGFGMGANDVANAFGTSVGSGVLSLKWAYILAVIFETLGALLVGYNVTDTMRKGVVDVELYNSTPKALYVGQVSILGGCSAWLLIATFARLPVSTTHSITGATLGFGLVTKGFSGIRWMKILQIAASWFISPVLSGMVSCILFMIVDFSVLRRKNPFKCGLRALPYFYWCAIAFNVFAVSYQGSKLLHLSAIPLWLCLCISFGVATVCAVLIHFILAPRLKIWIEKKVTDVPKVAFENEEKGDVQPPVIVFSADTDGLEGVAVCDKKPKIWSTATSEYSCSSTTASIKDVKTELEEEKPSCLKSVKKFFIWLLPARDRKSDAKTLRIFSSIQVFTACFAGFAHGANDVSNAIAPLTSLVLIYMDMDVSQKGETPIYVLLYGVLSICIGLVLLGKKVIRTVGTRMSEVNPASGFTIEFGAAVTTLLASKVGIPISTTHSLVGSVVAVGTIRSEEGIDWKIFRNIALSWILTLPITGAISAVLMLLLKLAL